MLSAGVVWPVVAGAADAERIDIVVVKGNLDARLVSFVIDAVASSGASLVILEIDTGAVFDDGIWDLVELVADAPRPLAVWVGPSPASAYGGAAVVTAAAPIRGGAPGVTIGLASPAVVGGADDSARIMRSAPGFPVEALSGVVAVGVQPVPGLIDVVEPSIGQFIIALHGTEVTVGDQVVVLETARADIDDEGLQVLKPALPVRFIEPGVFDRVLQTTTQPETAFFFLVLGLGLAVFEFFAAGPGIAAGVAAALLLLAGHGMVVLPVWWPATAAILTGLVLYVVEFQRNELGWKSILGTLLLGFGGLRFVEASPQLAVTWWTVILVVLGAAVFFGFALTTVARARFATQTIGREHLVGRAGVARGRVAVDGLVEVDGATWKARATRAAGIEDGDRVVVAGVEGIVLRVDPLE